MINDFNQRLNRGERLFGTMITVGSAAVAEILAGVGFDWLFVDGEHAPIETAELKSICLLYTSPSPRDQRGSRMPSSA